jgi:hypothetical protein
MADGFNGHKILKKLEYITQNIPAKLIYVILYNSELAIVRLTSSRQR